ncbi:MAG: ABC transporter ATP-binding protein [Hyphomicrobiaceae bacterium]|nr:ABC transporter ATP-binding protein [Hyphomicrobiaceae bacterium]
MLNLVSPRSPTGPSPRSYRNDQGRIEIDNVGIVFDGDRGVHTAVESTSITIEPGQFVCILGPSGCGKSTLLNSVAGYVAPTTGEIRVDGEPVRGPGPDRGMVFQQYSLFPWMTVRENVAFGPRISRRGAPTPEAIADTFIEMVGLTRFAKRYPRELSGGMQQRVGIARALANYPRVLLMDEPFGALDSQTRAMMSENLLKIWAEFGITVLFVTHDIDEAIFLGDRVLVMSASPGRVIADIKIDLPRPRDSDLTVDEGFIRYKRLFHAQIRQESLKAFEQQNR